MPQVPQPQQASSSAQMGSNALGQGPSGLSSNTGAATPFAASHSQPGANTGQAAVLTGAALPQQVVRVVFLWVLGIWKW